MKELAKTLKKLLSNNIIDIIIFGSAAKGAISPGDLDLIILSGKPDSAIADKINRLIGMKADIQFLSLHDYDKYIWLTMAKEGYSVRHNNFLSEVYNIKPVVLFKYSLKSLSNSNKVMFHRALKNFKGAEKVSSSVVLVPVKLSSEFSDLLRQWNIDLDSSEYHLLPLVRKEE